MRPNAATPAATQGDEMSVSYYDAVVDRRQDEEDEADRLDALKETVHEDLTNKAMRALREGSFAAEKVVQEWQDGLSEFGPINGLIANLIRAGLAAGLPEAAQAQEMLAYAYAEALCESEAMERMA